MRDFLVLMLNNPIEFAQPLFESLMINQEHSHECQLIDHPNRRFYLASLIDSS